MKVAAITGLALLAACAAAPPERLRTPKRLKRPPENTADATPATPPVRFSWPQPQIVLPQLPAPPTHADPSEFARWPLSQATHPSLEPAFAIARVFAQPGVSWIDLCARGVQNRRGGGIAEAHRAYLTAWCRVLEHDASAAVIGLSTLMSTTQYGIPGAIRQDVANIVVDAGNADVAEDLLNRAHIDDVAVYDLVAATYVEVGRTDDALRFNNRAMASTARSGAGACERRAREILLAPEYARDDLIAHLEREHRCPALAGDLACWSNTDRCAAPLTPAHYVHMAYGDWPTGPADGGRWWTVASIALRGFPAASGADVLATAALSAAVRSSRCSDITISRARTAAAEIMDNKAHDTSLDPQLNQLIRPQLLCQP